MKLDSKIGKSLRWLQNEITCQIINKLNYIGECTSCTSCSQKVDCGVLGTTQTECEADGCLWCPVTSGNDPWCFYKSGSSGGGGEENESCTVDVS